VTPPIFFDPDGLELEIHVDGWKSRIQSIRKNTWNSSIEFFKISNFVNPGLSIYVSREFESILLSGLAMRSKFYWLHPPDYLEKCVDVLEVGPLDIRKWSASFSELKAEVIGFLH
jgi:hypothetical protein